MYYSSTAVTYSSGCVPSSYAALCGGVVKATWVQKTNLQNMSTTHTSSHERTRPPTEPQTSRTNLPTHDVLQQYCSTYSRTCVGTWRVYPLCRAEISIFLRFSATPGSERPIPERPPLHATNSPNRASAATLSPETPRGVLWGGRGAVVAPRGVGWRSGLASVFWVCYNRHVFKYTFQHHHHDHYHHYIPRSIIL